MSGTIKTIWSLCKHSGLILGLSHFRLFCVFALVDSIALAKQDVPPFSVEAIVVTEFFHPPETNAEDRIESKISFTYSNRFWEIEQTSYSQPKFVKRLNGTNGSAMRVLNCKRVPEGIRYYNLFFNQSGQRNGKGLPISNILPTTFPPAGCRELLLAWLTLCPSPELPIIESNRIRRFTSFESLNIPDNEGTYIASYLDADNTFLSRLEIMDNGTVLMPGGSSRRRGPPFESGFIGFKFLATEKTAFNGIVFPKRATLKILTPMQNARTQEDSFAQLVCSIEVLRVVGSLITPTSVPPPLFVIDRRIVVPTTKSATYVVSNDQYLSITNPALVQLGKIINSRTKSSVAVPKHMRRDLILGILLLVTVAPAVVILISKKQRIK